MEFWQNKSILITGGTSGLGQALAQQLTETGAQVAVVSRNPPRIKIEHVYYIRGDISNKDQIHGIYAEALTRLGQIDVLINNASALGSTPLRLLIDTDCEDFAMVLETNVLGPFRLTKLVLPDMLLRHSGLVVNISSDAAINPYPAWGTYGVSKAALDHLTRIFQAELDGIHFLALDPGDMDTPMHLAAVPDADRSQLHKPDDSARLILQQIANGQFQPTRRSVR